MRTVARLSIAPVKSTRLIHPDQVRLERYGVPENRRFYLADPEGRLVSGDKNGSLMRIKASYDAARERLSLSFPDGTTVEGDTTSLGDPVVTGFYNRPVRGHVVEGPWPGAISSYPGRP